MADAASPHWPQDIDRLLAGTPDNASLRAALAQSQKEFNRQTRQLDRLVKLADANAAKLTASNHALDRLSRNLARFVPQPVVEGLRAGNSKKLQTVKRADLTLFFSDIVGFTSMSERLEPEHLASLMGTYFAEMTAICDRWGGTLDQFIGDAIVIFFGDPTSSGPQDDAVNAVNMALEMQQRLQILREQWLAGGADLAIHVRMGLSSGYCSVGNFGSTARLHYTAFGNVVNEAARLQQQCPQDRVVMAEATYRRVRDRINCRKAGQTQLAGRRHPAQIYEPVSSPSDAAEGDIVTGTDDGFRLHLDRRLLTNPARVATLLKTALASLQDHHAK
jgi:adenylate cyclase